MTDLLARLGSAFFWWCLPLALGFGGQAFWPHVEGPIWALSLAWMGTGCILNAVRCRRLHCYIVGPVFLIAAIVEILMAAGLVVLGAHAASNVAGAALVLALLSFVPELIWGRYVRRIT
jgi:hypothetical protein